MMHESQYEACERPDGQECPKYGTPLCRSCAEPELCTQGECRSRLVKIMVPNARGTLIGGATALPPKILAWCRETCPKRKAEQ